MGEDQELILYRNVCILQIGFADGMVVLISKRKEMLVCDQSHFTRVLKKYIYCNGSSTLALLSRLFMDLSNLS